LKFLILESRMKKIFFPQDTEVSKKIFILALPVIFSNLSRVLMSLFDLAMVGGLGPEAIAATGMGGMVFYGLISEIFSINFTFILSGILSTLLIAYCIYYKIIILDKNL